MAVSTAVIGFCLSLSGDVGGKGIVSVMTKATLPEATLSVIDPEGGTSTGTVGSEVNLAQGDIIVFRYEFTPAPEGVSFGINHYLTQFTPDNLEVVGIRLVDENGKTVLPSMPGRAYDGCNSGSCNSTGNGTGDIDVPCAAGTCSEPSGSLAQVYGDTGVFYTEDPRLLRVPNDEFLALTGGDASMIMGSDTDNEPAQIFPTYDTTLGISATWFGHNLWDRVQMLVFGAQTGQDIGGGTGNPPHLYGSPVAGANAGYTNEAEIGTDINDVELNGTEGPWIRARYPGSLIAQTEASLGTTGDDDARRVADASSTTPADPDFRGDDITPNNSLNSGAIIRVASGQLVAGRPLFVEIAARVDTDFTTDLVLDPVHGANIVCGDIFGGGNTQDTVWGFYAPDPQCTILRAIVDVTSNDPIAPFANAPVSFDVLIKNLAVLTDESIVLHVQQNFDKAMTFTGITGGTIVDPCPVLDTGAACTQFSIGDLAPSEELAFIVDTFAGGNGQESSFVKVNYTSAGNTGQPSVLGPLPAPGYTGQGLTQSRLIGIPVETMTWTEPSPTPLVAAGGVADFSGTLSNIGVADVNYGGVTLTLPTDWTAVSPMTVDGASIVCTSDCLTSTPFFAFTEVIVAGASIDYSLSVNVDGATAPGNYTLDAEWNVQTATSFDAGTVYSREIASVSVGAIRSEAPTLDCPIASSGSGITGTSNEDDGTDICVYINLINRGCTTVSGGTWSLDVSGTFGQLYAGLEVTATAENDTGAGENESLHSAECPGGVTNTKECSDGINNDPGDDDFIDFPADPGCSSPSDNSESPNAPEPVCSTVDDDDGDSDGGDFGSDFQCFGPDDDDETNGGTDQCSDGDDNDLDGLIDGADPSCAKNAAAGFDSERDYMECQNVFDDDTDTVADFPTDPGCYTGFDDDEADVTGGSSIIKPRILLVFDTSGSMNNHVCALPAPNNLATDFTGGDGSFECPGSDLGDPALCPANTTTNDSPTPLANDSRLFKVKEGVADVVASFGEVEYGLMRFKQRPQDFGCPGDVGSFGSGGWIGGGTAGNATPELACNPFNEGELLVRFSPGNSSSILKWMDHDSNYGELNAGAGADVDGLTAPYGLDWELRGTGSTPLAGALESAREAVYQQIQDDLDSGDPAVVTAAGCRPYRIIVITDGLESCKGSPEVIADELFTATGETLPSGGTPPSIPVQVIGFSSGDPALETGLNLIAQAGAGRDAIIVSDEAELSNEMATLVSDSIVTEFCDGEDNDCDGDIDEGFGIYENELTVDFGLEDDPSRLYETCDNQLEGVCAENGTLRCLGGVVPADRNTEVVCCDTPNARNTATTTLWEENLCLTEVGFPVPGTEVCGNGDEDCDGKVDEAPLVCNCVTEVCDGTDNDCDGLTDEDTGAEPLPGVGQLCGPTQVIPESICRQGAFICADDGTGTITLVCDGDVAPELEDDLATDCDGEDDDCDGVVDEVVEVCYTGLDSECPADTALPCVGVCRRGLDSCIAPGQPGAPGTTGCVGEVLPSAEQCNGLDDNCNGAIDEGFDFNGIPLGGACDNGADGICFAAGTVVCPGVCDAPTIAPQAEICDGVDNDCDGNVDELFSGVPGEEDGGVGAPVGDACNSTTCGVGTFACVGGQIICEGSTAGTDEVCDGIDNDCDTFVDEHNPPSAPLAEVGDACTPPGNAPDGRPYADIGDTGECEFGSKVCVGGVISCDNYKGPTDEVCDGLDNNCDGIIDDDAPCGGGEICNEGACIGPCGDGEFPCAFGFYCADVVGESEPFCLPDPCASVDCPEGFACETGTGVCSDLCEDVQCQTGEVCQSGFCLDCFNLGCEDGELCVANEFGVGICEVDLCPDDLCAADQLCVEGECLDLDCDPECGEGDRCVNGSCVADPCATKNCPNNQVCNPIDGECVSDQNCEDRTCGEGLACDPATGDCVSDSCTGVDCPEGKVCELDFGGGPICVTPEAPEGDWISPGGSGCSVGGTSGSSGGLLLVLLALAASTRRRRRR
jgi:MYXO-CTERM domain-containing protein